ncbi:hypothetical protein Tamer19_31960 [Cupriavidus sp. TA19]|nr:hypothetical protein Tamer19_31960 [Cupriavidus sp. TA19]
MNTSADRAFMVWSDGGCSMAAAAWMADESGALAQPESMTASVTALAIRRNEGFMTPFPFLATFPGLRL